MAEDADLAILRTIIGVQHAINEADPTADAVMKIVVDEARRATDAPAAVVELAEGDEMVYTATSGTVSGNEGLRLSLSGRLSGRAATTGLVISCPDTETDDRVDREACRRVHARSMVVVPLRHGSRILGVLKVMSNRPHAFAGLHIRLLEELAQFISTALGRATVMDQRTSAAATDSLTGLANRAGFLAALERVINGATTNGEAEPVAAVLYIDLDGFKPINDTYGHGIGDEVLRQVGSRLRAACDVSDVAARIGGDEFAVLVTGTRAPGAGELREELADHIKIPIATGAGPVSIGVSCGCAFVFGNDVAESVMARADAEMYVSKRSGKDAGRDGGESRM